MTMKLYTFPAAPSPRRVHLFLAEKGLEIEQVIVDLLAGEHLADDFACINRQCTLPVLELDDGTCLCESVAICRYLEEIHPDPPLLGSTAEQRAVIADIDHWVEMNGLVAVIEAFRNALPRMKDHALPGRRPVPQIAELAERGRKRYGWFLDDVDEMLAKREFVAGNTFSVADISTLVAIDFAAWGIKIEIPESLANLTRWYDQVSSRPSVAACA